MITFYDANLGIGEEKREEKKREGEDLQSPSSRKWAICQIQYVDISPRNSICCSLGILASH
jgi:hypothetical protein